MAVTAQQKSSARGQAPRGHHLLPAPPLDTARQLALAALDDAGGDLETAADALSAKILSSPDLIKTHLAKIVEAWAHEQIRFALRDQRKSIVRSASAMSRPGLDAAMRNELARLMDMPIYGGKRIGDATPAEIRASAGQYRTSARSYGVQATWQEAVAAAAEKNGPADKPIKSTLSEATLAKLWEEADAQ